MKKIPWITFVCIFLIAGQTLALEITSLAPVRGTPGTLVAISGGPFSPQTQPFLGEQYVAPPDNLKKLYGIRGPLFIPG